MSGSVGYSPDTQSFLPRILNARARAVWSWFTHSTIGLILLQIPLLPILLLRAPSTIAIDLAPLFAVAKALLTAAMVSLTIQNRF